MLSIINSKIEKDYKSYSNDPETKDCFEGASFTPFNFDQLAIDFDVNKINFNVTFGLSGACMSVDGTIISFNLDEIQNYLNYIQDQESSLVFLENQKEEFKNIFFASSE